VPRRADPPAPPVAARSAPGLRLAVGALLLATLSGCISSGIRTDYSYDPDYGVASPEFLRSLAGLKNGMLDGNAVTLLENGDGLFPDLLRAIAGAQESVNVELYIFSDGEIGRRIADALIERARAGVGVRVLVDALGARLGGLADEMRTAGVNFRIYKPVRIYSLARIGHRTHRKIVTIDGRIGYCGGFGFDDRWRGDARSERQWRDLAVRVDGPAVRQFQRIFMEDWVNTTGEVLAGNAQFPVLKPVGDVLVQVISSSRNDQSSMSKLMLYMAIQAARSAITIENAYFVPDAQIRRALIRAARRGVAVRIVVPGSSMDIPAIRRASQYHYGELLDAGIAIYEYQPTMLHSKAMVVDGVWATVGSINFDTRSMRKNAEANVVVYDTRFAAQLNAVFSQDVERSVRLTKRLWAKRGVLERVRELFASFFSEMY
jgi:cardiolipin synthase